MLSIGVLRSGAHLSSDDAAALPVNRIPDQVLAALPDRPAPELHVQLEHFQWKFPDPQEHHPQLGTLEKVELFELFGEIARVRLLQHALLLRSVCQPNVLPAIRQPPIKLGHR